MVRVLSYHREGLIIIFSYKKRYANIEKVEKIKIS